MEINFNFKYVFYTNKKNTTKTKCEVPTITALFSSVELFPIYGVPWDEYQN